jgi:lipopolysaccharide transport system ATP-binding protein
MHVVGQAGVPMLVPGQATEILVKYAFRDDVGRAIFGLQIRTPEGDLVYSTNTFLEGGDVTRYDAGAVVVVRWKFTANLSPRRYLLMFGVSQFDDLGQETIAIDRRSDVMLLVVTGDTGAAQGVANLQAKFEVAAVV